MKETSERAKNWKCVRFNPERTVNFKFNRKVQGELMRNFFHFCVKWVEKQASPTSVAKEEEFQEFPEVLEGLKWKALPEDYRSSSPDEKKKMATKLVDEIYNELSPVVSQRPDQGMDIQADYSDSMQVGAGNARQFDMTDKEVNNPSEIQVDEVPAGAPIFDFGNTLSNDASLQNVAWSPWDNPEGRPPSRPPVQLDIIVSVFNDLMLRASRFPGILPKFEWSEEAFRSFVIELEYMEGALEDLLSTNFRYCEEEYFPPLADFTECEAVTSLPSMEESLADEIWSNIVTSPGRPEAPGTSPDL